MKTAFTSILSTLMACMMVKSGFVNLDEYPMSHYWISLIAVIILYLVYSFNSVDKKGNGFG